jgi:hypothetical protein
VSACSDGYTASEFTVGSVLGRVFSAFSRSPFLFWIWGFIVILPGILMKDGRGQQIVNLFFGQLAQGIIACGVFEALRGNRVTFGKEGTSLDNLADLFD